MRVIITGATSGIGAALAARLVADGAKVVGIGRSPSPLDIRSITCDLTDPAARAAAFAEAVAALGEIDAVVSNAGEAVFARPTEPAPWARLFELHVTAAAELCAAAAPRLARGAQIVLVSSVTSRYLPAAAFGAYAASKAALDTYAEALRLELAPRGARVCRVAPGLVDTPIYDRVAGFDAQRARLREAIPRWLDAADVAETIHWILGRPPHVSVADITLLPVGQAR